MVATTLANFEVTIQEVNQADQVIGLVERITVDQVIQVRPFNSVAIQEGNPYQEAFLASFIINSFVDSRNLERLATTSVAVMDSIRYGY